MIGNGGLIIRFSDYQIIRQEMLRPNSVALAQNRKGQENGCQGNQFQRVSECIILCGTRREYAGIGHPCPPPVHESRSQDPEVRSDASISRIRANRTRLKPIERHDLVRFGWIGPPKPVTGCLAIRGDRQGIAETSGNEWKRFRNPLRTNDFVRHGTGLGRGIQSRGIISRCDLPGWGLPGPPYPPPPIFGQISCDSLR
jgi:hypothetical protein